YMNERTKIDFVIAWVDGADPAWQAKKIKYTAAPTQKAAQEVAQETAQDATGRSAAEGNEKTSGSDYRYRDWGTLRYLFRSIEKYASWVHRVYLVTDAQKPDWLDEANPKVRIVDHKDFIPKEYLPTFNANTIELNLHRIPGLSEQFVFFNDDFLLTHKTKPEDFFYQGLPADEAALNGINGKDPEFAGIQFANMNLVNRHYDRNAILKNLADWMRPSYGKENLRTLLLLPFKRLQGIYNPHGPMPLLKRTCEKVWERDGNVLDQTCLHMIRTASDVTSYVFRYEQLLSGDFFAKRARNAYHEVSETARELRGALHDERYLSVCLNDVEMSQREYVRKREELKKVLDGKYLAMSTFERRQENVK
ncbi:MAG: Stealth CR1 domain-containing protein, partial [Lachnospiraceae bacterium]|nr:Stealth CR1 domain-containing protein [Lachnospiraceae bacterium]